MTPARRTIAAVFAGRAPPWCADPWHTDHHPQPGSRLAAVCVCVERCTSAAFHTLPSSLVARRVDALLPGRGTPSLEPRPHHSNAIVANSSKLVLFFATKSLHAVASHTSA